jgi:hypothetical protein
VANWWDAMELWITQLAFGFQVLLAMVIVVPLCCGVAVAADRLVDAVAARIADRRH